MATAQAERPGEKASGKCMKQFNQWTQSKGKKIFRKSYHVTLSDGKQSTWHNSKEPVYYSHTHTEKNLRSGHVKFTNHTKSSFQANPSGPQKYPHTLLDLDPPASGPQYCSSQLWFNSHRWSVRPDQVPPLLWFFPSILWTLEGRALRFGWGWRRWRWKNKFILKSDDVRGGKKKSKYLFSVFVFLVCWNCIY